MHKLERLKQKKMQDCSIGTGYINYTEAKLV